MKSLSYIHLNETEMHNGYFAYYCTSKAIELRLQNIDGLVELHILVKNSLSLLNEYNKEKKYCCATLVSVGLHFVFRLLVLYANRNIGTKSI